MYDRTHRNPYFLNVINKYEEGAIITIVKPVTTIEK